MEFPFEQAAMRREEMPSGLSREEQQLFLSLRMLYYQMSIGLIDRETGKAEKKKLVRVYNNATQASAFRDKCGDHAVKLWRSIEQAANEYAKTKSPEAAERMYRTIYGMPEATP
ncbi:hypothetical protein AAEU42_13170 [Pseudoflavonifractor phocaeensis]|uniref:hypothetical protein n=1 Tax=Pseudoflavonifractor phocaeensis TaxID=1870988 RepID=UPI00313E501C